MRSLLRQPSKGEWVYFLVIACLIGVLGFSRPFEPYDWLQKVVTAQINAKDYQGDGVIVAIDNETLAQRPSGEWGRSDLAALLDEVAQANPEQIIVDRQFFGTARESGANRLRASLEKLSQKPLWHIDVQPEDVVDLSRSSDALKDRAWTGTSSKIDVAAQDQVTPAVMTFSPFALGAPVYAPVAISTKEGNYPSLALLMADKATRPDNNTFEIDLSYGPKSVPRISADTVLNGDFDTQSLTGKRVLISFTDELSRDTFGTARDRYTTRAAATILAAQTLIDGPPVSIGWLPAFAMALIGALSWLMLRRPYGRLIALTIFFAIMISPVFTEQNLVFQNTSNGIFLILLLAIGRGWRRVRRAIRTYRNAAETKSWFLAQASHDLRQPIHAIGLLSDRLSQTELSTHQKELVSKISWSVDNASRMFRALLDIAAIESGTLQTDIGPVSINDLLAEIDSQSGLVAEQAGVDLRLIPSELVVKTDRALISTMLQNLVSNAIRYAPGKTVLVGCRRKGGKISLFVVDNGRGISPAELKHVQKEFYRSASRSNLRSDNKGLGLAIVNKLARLLGLKFGLQSQEGAGTTASISGLEKLDSIPPQKAVQPTRTLPLSGLKIVLCDDDTETLKSTTGLLEQWGCQVEAHTTPPKFPIDCDILLSDFDFGNGITLANYQSEISHLEESNIPTIIISGHHPDQIKATLPEFSGLILPKPLRAAGLRSALMSAKSTA